MFPNLVIIGAPKSGTTSLFAWLVDHPAVCGSKVKEARYFLDPDDPLFKRSSNFRDHGLAGYEEYFTDCKNGKPSLVVEATPVYLYQQTAPEGLSRIEPLPQLVVMLRKPSERVFSHFHFLRDSHARIDSRLPFDEFVRRVEARDPDIPPYGHAKDVIALSRYSDYFPAWLERFPLERFHFFLFEDLRRDPRSSSRRSLPWKSRALVLRRLRPAHREPVLPRPKRVAAPRAAARRAATSPAARASA